MFSVARHELFKLRHTLIFCVVAIFLLQLNGEDLKVFWDESRQNWQIQNFFIALTACFIAIRQFGGEDGFFSTRAHLIPITDGQRFSGMLMGGCSLLLLLCLVIYLPKHSNTLDFWPISAQLSLLIFPIIFCLSIRTSLIIRFVWFISLTMIIFWLAIGLEGRPPELILNLIGLSGLSYCIGIACNFFFRKYMEALGISVVILLILLSCLYSIEVVFPKVKPFWIYLGCLSLMFGATLPLFISRAPSKMVLIQCCKGLIFSGLGFAILLIFCLGSFSLKHSPAKTVWVERFESENLYLILREHNIETSVFYPITKISNTFISTDFHNVKHSDGSAVTPAYSFRLNTHKGLLQWNYSMVIVKDGQSLPWSLKFASIGWRYKERLVFTTKTWAGFFLGINQLTGITYFQIKDDFKDSQNNSSKQENNAILAWDPHTNTFEKLDTVPIKLAPSVRRNVKRDFFGDGLKRWQIDSSTLNAPENNFSCEIAPSTELAISKQNNSIELVVNFKNSKDSLKAAWKLPNWLPSGEFNSHLIVQDEIVDGNESLLLFHLYGELFALKISMDGTGSTLYHNALTAPSNSIHYDSKFFINHVTNDHFDIDYIEDDFWSSVKHRMRLQRLENREVR